jgi:hypothetical protein
MIRLSDRSWMPPGPEPERRDIFLQRVEPILRLRHRFDDADVADVAKLSLAGLVHCRHPGPVGPVQHGEVFCGHSADTKACLFPRYCSWFLII